MKPKTTPRRRPLPLSLRREYRATKDGDAWGRVMSWRFALADYLTTRGLPVPASWQFRQSPFGPDKSSYEYQALNRRNDAPGTLARFGAALARLDNICRAAGRDY